MKYYYALLKICADSSLFPTKHMISMEATRSFSLSRNNFVGNPNANEPDCRVLIDMNKHMNAYYVIANYVPSALLDILVGTFVISYIYLAVNERELGDKKGLAQIHYSYSSVSSPCSNLCLLHFLFATVGRYTHYTLTNLPREGLWNEC